MTRVTRSLWPGHVLICAAVPTASAIRSAFRNQHNQPTEQLTTPVIFQNTCRLSSYEPSY